MIGRHGGEMQKELFCLNKIIFRNVMDLVIKHGIIRLLQSKSEKEDDRTILDVGWDILSNGYSKYDVMNGKSAHVSWCL